MIKLLLIFFVLLLYCLTFWNYIYLPAWQHLLVGIFSSGVGTFTLITLCNKWKYL